MTEPIEIEVSRCKECGEPKFHIIHTEYGTHAFVAASRFPARVENIAQDLPKGEGMSAFVGGPLLHRSTRVEPAKPEEQREWCAVCKAYQPIEMREDRMYCYVCDTFLTRMVDPGPSATDGCKHVPAWIDAGPLSDDIGYKVCANCGVSLEPTPERGEGVKQKAIVEIRKHYVNAPDDAWVEAHCPMELSFTINMMTERDAARKENARLTEYIGTLTGRYRNLSRAVGKPPSSSRALEHFVKLLKELAEKAEVERDTLRHNGKEAINTLGACSDGWMKRAEEVEAALAAAEERTEHALSHIMSTSVALDVPVGKDAVEYAGELRAALAQREQ